VSGLEAGVRVVVVGAGLAGLMAAWRLTQRGCEVVVLEARERVGGRVWSQELVPGDPRTVIERGAEFVLDGYDVLREVAAGLGLELAGTVMSYYQRESRDGEPVSALAVADGPATWAARAAALRPELDTDPARAVVTTWNDDPWAGESYSADTVTAAPGDPAILAAPAGRIHFAGEHTAGEWAGLMEGALRSGQRVASEVLASQHTAC
jgi:monoamine oxidase